MIIGMPCDHLTLGESTTTPPQGVNGINLPNPSLFNPRCSVVTFVQFIQPSQNISHHVKQPLTAFPRIGTIMLTLMGFFFFFFFGEHI